MLAPEVVGVPFTAVHDREPVPVEYAVAVERYLAAAGLAEGSRRVYRIALATWAWALVGRTPPAGPARRGAVPPALPLARLAPPAAPDLLREAFAARCAAVGPRTANREAAALDAALAWWRGRGWLPAAPAARVPRTRPAPAPARLTASQAAGVLALAAPLREQTLWHLLYESGAPLARLLALDAGDLDLPARRLRPHRRPAVRWGPGSARLLPLLTLGHPTAPVFRTARRTRLSARRAAELLTTATRPLDPAGHGWTPGRLAGAERG
jgi:integrase